MKKVLKQVIFLALIITLTGSFLFFKQALVIREDVKTFEAEAAILCEGIQNKTPLIEGDYNFVQHYIVGEMGYVFVLNENFEIIIHPNTSLIGTSILGKSSLLDDILKDLNVNAVEYLYFDLDEGESMSCFYQLQNGYYIGITSVYLKGYF